VSPVVGAGCGRGDAVRIDPLDTDLLANCKAGKGKNLGAQDSLPLGCSHCRAPSVCRRTSLLPGPGNGDAMTTWTLPTPTRRAGRLAVSLAAVLMSLSLVAPATATQPAAQVMHHHEAPMTTVTLRIAHCAGCVVDVFHTAGTDNFRPLRTVPIKDGVGRFTVRTAATHGMSFGMTDTGPYTGSESRPDIAVALAGVPIGAPVTVAKARHAHAASWCWSGTSRARFTIHVRLVTYKSLNVDGTKRLTLAAFWASPNLPGFQRRHLAHFKGRPNVADISDQDAPFCT
jgi:hypothetical protein